MNATPADQRILLDLVDLDRRILVTEASRKNPPQAVRVAELTAQKQGQSQELAQRLGARDDVALELSRLESDVRSPKRGVSVIRSASQPHQTPSRPLLSSTRLQPSPSA